MTVLLVTVMCYGTVIGLICGQIDPSQTQSFEILDNQIYLVEIAGSLIGFVSFAVLMAIRCYEVQQKGPMVVKQQPVKAKLPEAKAKEPSSDSDEEALIER